MRSGRRAGELEGSCQHPELGAGGGGGKQLSLERKDKTILRNPGTHGSPGPCTASSS